MAPADLTTIDGTDPINGYDPFDPAVTVNPFPYYAWLRDHAPVYHNEARGIWVLSRYDDVRAALRSHEVFSSTEGVGSERRPLPMLVAYDPPEHTRLRRIVQRDFTPTAINTTWTPTVAALVDELVGDLIERGTADVSTTLAYPLPIAVIADILGVPRDRRDQFKRWSDEVMAALGGGLDAETSARVETAILEFAEYCYGVIKKRRHQPGDDLISLLVSPRGGELLTEDELVSFVVLLLVAGNETTTNLIGNMILAFCRNPEQWAALRARPELVPNAMEEILRYDPPVQGFFRNTTQPYELHGSTIPAGEKVMMLYGSANHDPTVFPDPERFDVTRAASVHLAFGAGIHVCLGAPLARLEGTLLLRRLVERVELFELAGDVVRPHNPLLRGVAHLPVTVTPA